MKLVQILPENIDVLDIIKLHTNLQIAAKDIKVQTDFKIN
jgi:hypothetical protein